MSNPRTFQIQEISAHPGPVAGQGTRREEEVCKYIDVTTCIGCKACEVACVEWNDHPFRETTFDDTYQTMPSTEWNYWNLIKFAEDERVIRGTTTNLRVNSRPDDRRPQERDCTRLANDPHRDKLYRQHALINRFEIWQVHSVLLPCV